MDVATRGGFPKNVPIKGVVAIIGRYLRDVAIRGGNLRDVVIRGKPRDAAIGGYPRDVAIG